jgi:hypothetical protein
VVPVRWCPPCRDGHHRHRWAPPGTAAPIAVGIGACAIALSDAEEEVDQAATELEQDVDEAQRDLNKDLREDQRAFDAYDDCLKENNYRFAPCRELDPLR